MSNDQGVLRAVTRVYLTDIFGKHVSRRISIGIMHSVNLVEARDHVAYARKSNPDMDIRAEFKVEL